MMEEQNKRETETETEPISESKLVKWIETNKLKAMESLRNHGGSEEEYSSCESGWTMYIEDAFRGNDHSPVVVDDDEDDSQVKEADDGYENDNGDSSEDDGDEESDDSMASDASSGPSNQLLKSINKHAAGKNGSKQVYHQKRQNTEKSLSNEGEKSELKSRTRTSAARHVQSRGKVSKTK